MSLEDFAREVKGQPPKNRSWSDRWVVTDEDGCSYDMQVATVRLPIGIGLVLVATLLFVAWVADDPFWNQLMAHLKVVWDFVKWLILG